MSVAAPRFTVLMRTGRSPELFPSALASVLAQNEPSFELLMWGAPPAPGAPAIDDPRVRFVGGNSAAPVHDARGTLVAHADDETLWFPDHLAELGSLLEVVDFGNLLHTELDPDGSLSVTGGDLADVATQERMLRTRWSCVTAGCAGYRLAAYRALPAAAAPPPADVPADLALWRRFLDAPEVSVGTRFAIESLTLVAAYRPDRVLRGDEGSAVLAQIRDERGRRDLRSRALASWQADFAATQASLDRVAAELHSVYRSRGEIAAKVAEYAESRAAYAESRAAYAQLNAELGSELAQRDELVAAQAAQLEQLQAQVRRLRSRLARRKPAPVPAPRPLVRRVVRRVARRLPRRR